MISRRRAVQTAAALALAGALPLRAAEAQYAEYPEGNPDARVTVVEYASLGCPHCRDFYLIDYPMLKRDYIDTGKIRFIFRDFPLDNRALGATMIARCVPPDKFKTMIDAIFRTQEIWVMAENAFPPLAEIARRMGMTDEGIGACMESKALFEKIAATREAGQKLGVTGTPAFTVNGKLVVRSDMGNEGNYGALKRYIEEALQ